MPVNTTHHQLKTESLLNDSDKLHDQGRYEDALGICLQITRAYPKLGAPWFKAALNCAPLGRWQDVIRYGQTALALGSNGFSLYDALAHAHGSLGQWEKARRYGLEALNMRDNRFNGAPVIPPPDPVPMPPLPSAQTREHNLISFSLFGRDPKYCESAILNVQEQSDIYPHWVCRFYVDGSVPDSVIARLKACGAQIVTVGGAAALWPGPMWRLLALQDPLAHRILFRDADSVISRREAGAVEQWVASGKRFHMMRDWASHTELILAGLWSVVTGALPPLEQLMHRFMNVPLESRHFADQDFLRQYVWPYARASLMQHDSVFGFMGGIPFPDGARPDDFAVGEGAPSFFTVKSNLPDGTEVDWGIFRLEKQDGGQPRKELVCAYPGTVKEGAVTIHVPKRYLQWMQQGMACVGLRANSAT